MRPVLAALLTALASLHASAQIPSHPNAVQPRARVPSLVQRQAHSHAKAAAEAALTPLTPRERALQLLNRFTFGPRPGDLDRLLDTGPDAWLAQQLNPDTIPDPALNKRLADYPTLNLQPAEALALFPGRGLIQQVAEGKRPLPADPQIAAVYEVLVAKYGRDLDEKKTLPNGEPAHPELNLTDDGKAAQKKLDQATAARIAGDLYALPKNERMPALLRLPVPDRIAFTANVAGDQRNLLLAQFNPRERELFYAMSSGPGGSSYNILRELSEAKLLRAILSERQLGEVMTDFWFNHFNIYAPKDSDQWYTTTFERDAIRKHALGHFRDLLLSTATSPAMMVYLDNWLSVGPDSLANGVNPANPKSKRGNKGLNENFGREVMELHTIGVNGGYTQPDVTALSAILTGWTVDNPNLGGPFLFDPKRHQPGPKQWLGHIIDEQGNVTRLPPKPGTPQHPTPAQTPGAPSRVATNPGAPSSPTASSSERVGSAANLTGQPPPPVPPESEVPEGMRQGLQALDILAASPKTAHFISFLIAQRFLADIPPPALVDRLAATYLSTGGDIKSILRTLIQSPEFNSRQYFRNKVKTPVEFLASAFRSTATDPSNPGALVNTLKQMGMPPYNALPPTGYYITADQWMNSTALVDRLNFAYALTANKYANQKFDAPRVLALGLLAQPPNHTATGQGSTTTDAVFHPVADTVATTGPDIVLHTLEDTLIGSPVSRETEQLIGRQIAGLATSTTPPTDTLNLLTALLLGSPDFQRR